jgi:enediyne biosynthesis protein E4
VPARVRASLSTLGPRPGQPRQVRIGWLRASGCYAAPVIRLRSATASLALALAACRGPGDFDTSGDETITTNSEAETGSESETDTEDTGEPQFDPLVCGSWDPPAATPAGVLPAPTPCPAQGCPVFTEVAAAAGIDTVQYVPTHPGLLACIFPRPSPSGLSPRQDCEPQWFTGGVSVADVDNDGWPDLFVTRLAAPDHLFLNQGDGTFVDVAAQVGLGECSFSNGSVFGDIDNDGDQDLLVTSVGGTHHWLWVNQLAETGELRFVEDGEARGFALRSSLPHSGESVTLGDFDRDGWLDIHVNEWLRVEQTPAPGDPDHAVHGSRLLRNRGDGSFEDVTASYGVELFGLDPKGVFAFSSTFVDVDGDGWQELAIAVDFRRSRLYWNVDGAAYVDGSVSAKVNRESNAMGSTWADVDLDGELDWFVTSIAELDDECDPGEQPPCWSGTGNRMYRYAGERAFVELSEALDVRDGAWAWGTVLFDADNDGDPDLAVVNGWPGRDLNGGFYHRDTPTRLWINHHLEPGGGLGQPGLAMTEEGQARGFADTGQGRAVVSVDYDRDGDLDLLVINHAGAPKLFRNDSGAGNWLQIRVQGTVSNRDGRGAKVRVQVDADGPWLVREVGVGSHFLGEGELVQHFGLGAAQTVHQVEVEWPASGLVQTLAEVASAQTLVFVEGE